MQIPGRVLGKGDAGSPCRIVVNLGEELHEVTREARGLDRLGFAVPETVASIALQFPQLQANADGLTAMLARYHQVPHCAKTSLYCCRAKHGYHYLSDPQHSQRRSSALGLRYIDVLRNYSKFSRSSRGKAGILCCRTLFWEPVVA